MIESQAIFAGCNCALRIFDYNKATGYIAYGSQNTIQITSSLILDSQYNSQIQPFLTLRNSNAPITGVRWIPDHCKLIASCQDGNVYIWSYTNDDFILDQCLNISKHSISCIGQPTSHLPTPDLAYRGDRLVFGDSNGGLFVYSLNKETSKFEKSLEMQLPFGFFAMTISLLDVPNSDDELLAFIGGSKPTVHVVVLNLNSGNGEVVNSLPGHEDWVKSIAIKELKDNNGEREYLIATGCLDRVIRLWKLVLTPNSIPEQIETNKLKLLTSKEYKFKTNEFRGKVFIDAVLMGHDDWIGDLNWKSTDEMILMSSSADSSIMLWTPDPESGVWYPDVRLGGVSIKGASTATGAVGGFYSCAWIVTNDVEIILTNGKTGSFRSWVKNGNDYNAKECITGPHKDVTDLSWGANGQYLLSTSLDQTTRIYAQLMNGGKWFEFGRPQIHGFDMISVSSLNDTKFVSAGDEKVIRVFEMPQAVANMLTKLTKLKLDVNEEVQLPETATLPVLGLSNKADFDNTAAVEDEQDNNENNENNEGDSEKEAFSTALMNNLESPPMEEVLQRYTLWPEIEKLYGHGFEITTLDVSPDKSCAVSACRSNVSQHAGLRVFDTESWLEHDQNGKKGGLLGHDLTVTRVRFNGKVPGCGQVRSDIYLLAVSRDRKLSLWKKKEGDYQFELIEIIEKAHTRIIWDCAWVETEQLVSFVTISRDKEIKLWVLNEDNKLEVKAQYKFNKPVTAVDSYFIGNGIFKLGVGLDNGEIHILELDVNNFTFKNLEQIGDNLRAGSTISRISFSPNEPIMAVGSRDSSLRIFKL